MATDILRRGEVITMKEYILSKVAYKVSSQPRLGSSKSARDAISLLDSRLRGNDIGDAGMTLNLSHAATPHRNIRKHAITLFLITLLIFTFAPKSEAEDVRDTIIDILSGLTCETQGVGDLLRSEFSHTCIPAPFFTFLVANIVSPGLYANTLLRLKINDEQLFPNSCLRTHRIEPKDPKLSFAMCSNIKLAEVRAKAIADSAVAIAKAMLTGEDPWDDIKDAWSIPKEDYHNMFLNKHDGDNGIMYDVGIIPVFPWKVLKTNDRMCVATIGFSGWIPVGCKYIKEPYPESIYSSFMDGGDSDNTSGKDDMSLTRCSNAGSCYQRAYNSSKTGIVITAPLIECIKEMSARLLISNDVCSFDDINKVIDNSKRESSSLFQFQRNMHRTVAALLTIYVILYGFKIVLTGDVPPKNEAINFVLKIVFVTYFSVGINIHTKSNSDYDKLDGMVQWAFPFMLGGINQLAGWVMTASPSELCKFDASEYPLDISYISLWDSLDCRLSHYLGLDVLSTMFVENQARKHDFKNFDFFDFSIPPYFYLIIPAAMSGNMTLISLALMYPILVISVGAYMVNATVVCMISIVILGILAPLFVPMFLFEYTRGYFESWVKLMISFMLQPMVVTTFMITIFSVYDFGFYTNCKYKYSEVTSLERKAKIFYIDNNWDNYSEDEAKSCKNSLGFMLNNPIAAVFDYGKESINEIVKNNPDTKTDKYMSKFSFLSGILSNPGMFIIFPKLIYEKVKDIILALIIACFTLYLMYNFSAQLSEFAADMTEGVSLSSVTINPQDIYKATIGTMKKAMEVAKLAATAVATGGVGAAVSTIARKEIQDQLVAGIGKELGIGSGKLEDKISTAVSEAVDKVTTSDTTISPSKPAFEQKETRTEDKIKVDSKEDAIVNQEPSATTKAKSKTGRQDLAAGLKKPNDKGEV